MEDQPKQIVKETIPSLSTHDFNFKTFGDKTLIKMLSNVRAFCLDLKKGKYRWLTMSGPTEVGKTHLLKQVFAFLKDAQFDLPNKFNYPYIRYYAWSDMINQLFDKKLTLDTLKYTGLLIIEDLLSYRSFDNARGNPALDITYELLNSRLRKPTLIDTNKSHSEIMKLDARIGSRLLREGSVFYEIQPNTMNYLSRC